MVLITQNLILQKIRWIKCSFLKFSQLRDVVYIELGFYNYFISKHYRLLTTAIFIGSASFKKKFI